MLQNLYSKSAVVPYIQNGGACILHNLVIGGQFWPCLGSCACACYVYYIIYI